MQQSNATTRVAIACGGTGGHLFPGLAVAEQLAQRGCAVTLLISPKEVDQQAVRAARGMEIVTLPAVGFSRSKPIAFLRGCWQSYRAARAHFRNSPPRAVLAMGGFTSAPPVWAGRRAGAATFLHESNSIPGRANRLLAHSVDEAFVYFPEAAKQLSHQSVKVIGMPVRSQFQPHDPAACRTILGLAPERRTLLVMGGSQGAAGINELVLGGLARVTEQLSQWQFLHLTGPADADKARAAYQQHGWKAVVRPFLSEMELALGAATIAISRAGASSLAELAGMRVPAILIPYPAAADDHQFHNADAFVRSGAARMIEQKKATAELLVNLIAEIGREPATMTKMREALAQWHTPDAAMKIADRILRAIGQEDTRDARVEKSSESDEFKSRPDLSSVIAAAPTR